MTAQEIATLAHQGQFRRDGVTPYIEHPEAVAAVFPEDSWQNEIAWLHDVIEDTDWTAQDLLDNGINGLVVDAVMTLTHQKGESYEDYIARISLDDWATQVKLADIAANLADSPTERQRKKYAKAISYLAANLDFGQK